MSADLTHERKNSVIPPLKLSHILYGQKEYEQLLNDLKIFEPYNFEVNVYNEGRVAMMKDSIRVLSEAINHLSMKQESDIHAGLLHFGHQLPGSIHKGMYVTCIKMLGTDQQVKELIPKCDTMEMIGCYAQTELGHGSDVQSLETVAEFDAKTDEFVLNTPSLTAAKYWPGDLGMYANYALVFARLISNGNFQGIHSFVVPIRDANFQPLSGIELGDIGPKYGFHTKDNGYMIMKNVRIPRKNMLRRYASITDTGDLKIKGNPKIAYATMMLIRKIISCGYPRVLGQAVTIAGKYSMIRKQFKNESGVETPIIDYQLQQNKILSCIADFYCLSINGRILAELADANFKNVSEHDDDSLMAETHNCLCLGKALSTDITIRDIEICRLACGGHGFSQYSGLPSLLTEFSPFSTLQGENTVLYLQLSRFLLKSHKRAVAKKADLDNSVKYLGNFEQIMHSRVAVPANDLWRMEDLSLLLQQCTCYLITAANEAIHRNESGSPNDTKNKNAAIRLNQTAVLHSLLYYFGNFHQTVVKYNECPNIKKLLEQVCLLFGVNALLGKSFVLAETGLVVPEALSSLERCRERLLKELRPQAITLIDGVGLPDSAIRSLVVKGNIYENMYQAAKNSDINKEVIPAAHIIRKIKDIRSRL